MSRPCAEWAERLAAYIDNEASQLERSQVNGHLLHCAACREAARQWRDFGKETGGLFMTSSTEFVAQLRRELRPLHVLDGGARGYLWHWLVRDRLRQPKFMAAAVLTVVLFVAGSVMLAVAGRETLAALLTQARELNAQYADQFAATPARPRVKMATISYAEEAQCRVCQRTGGIQSFIVTDVDPSKPEMAIGVCRNNVECQQTYARMYGQYVEIRSHIIGRSGESQVAVASPGPASRSLFTLPKRAVPTTSTDEAGGRDAVLSALRPTASGTSPARTETVADPVVTPAKEYPPPRRPLSGAPHLAWGLLWETAAPSVLLDNANPLETGAAVHALLQAYHGEVTETAAYTLPDGAGVVSLRCRLPAKVHPVFIAQLTRAGGIVAPAPVAPVVPVMTLPLEIIARQLLNTPPTREVTVICR